MATVSPKPGPTLWGMLRLAASCGPVVGFRLPPTRAVLGRTQQGSIKGNSQKGLFGAVSCQHSRQRGNPCVSPQRRSWQLTRGSAAWRDFVRFLDAASPGRRCLLSLAEASRKKVSGQTAASILGATTGAQSSSSSANTSAGLGGSPGGVTRPVIPGGSVPGQHVFLRHGGWTRPPAVNPPSVAPGSSVRVE